MGHLNVLTKLHDDYLEYEDTIPEITGCDTFHSSNQTDTNLFNSDFTRQIYN